MLPRTGYVLPFPVRLGRGRVLSAGGPVEVRGILRGPPRAPDRALAALRTFADLASTGALAGAGVLPAKSLLVFDPDGAGMHPLHCVFPACAVDEAAAVVLTHLLLGCGDDYPLAGLSIAAPGTEAGETLATNPDELSDYPARCRPPFTVEDEEPDGDSFGITADFVAPLDEVAAARLRAELDRWFAAVTAGAYAVAPSSPSESYVETDDDAFVAFDSTAEWGFFNLRAATACLDGLVNLFAAFHDRVQPLVRLRIS